MLRLTIFLALFVVVKTENLLGVNYSFDVDFFTNFNSKRCDKDNNTWRLVQYEDLDIEPPYRNSGIAIQVAEESCASSFPIIFVGGTLEIKVYSQEISQSFNLRIEVFDEDDISITSYVHQRSSKRFGSGWQTISLKINKHVKGYIQFRGRSLNNEILLIDSFRYTPNITINNDRRSKRSIGFDKEDEDEIIFQYKVYDNQNEKDADARIGDRDHDLLESSGDDQHGTDEPPTDQPVIEEPQGRDTIWNPFTIALVSFGVLMVTAMILVGSYQFGKARARSNALVLFGDAEPPRTITIPRANATSGTNRSSPLRFYEF